MRVGIFGGAILLLLVVACPGGATKYENERPFQVDFPGGVRVVLDIDSYGAVWFDRMDDFSEVGNYSLEKKTYTATVDMTNSSTGTMKGNISFCVDMNPENGMIALPLTHEDKMLLSNSGIDISSISRLGEFHNFTAFGIYYAFIILDHGAVAVSAKSEEDRAMMLEILYFEQSEYPPSFLLHRLV